MINNYDEIEILDESIEVLDYAGSNDLYTDNCEKISRSLPIIVPDRNNEEIEQNNYYEYVYIIIIFAVTILTLIYMIAMVI